MIIFKLNENVPNSQYAQMYEVLKSQVKQGQVILPPSLDLLATDINAQEIEIIKSHEFKFADWQVGINNTIVCSECNNTAPTDAEDYMITGELRYLQTDYCPCCGAIMNKIKLY